MTPIDNSFFNFRDKRLEAIRPAGIGLAGVGAIAADMAESNDP
jgi:hypothetical protein